MSSSGKSWSMSFRHLVSYQNVLLLSGFPDIPAVTCSISFNREEPTTDEQRLPASAAGRQAVFTALPSWWEALGLAAWGFLSWFTYVLVLLLASPRECPSQHRVWPTVWDPASSGALCLLSHSFSHSVVLRPPLWKPSQKQFFLT